MYNLLDDKNIPVYSVNTEQKCMRIIFVYKK